MHCIFGLRQASEYRFEFTITADITLKIFALLLDASIVENNCMVIIVQKNYWFSLTTHEQNMMKQGTN